MSYTVIRSRASKWPHEGAGGKPTFRLRTGGDGGKLRDMLIVHVHVRVKPEFVEAFREATIENARNSVREPGIARFDIIQQTDDPTKFVFVEVYRNEAATAAHKATAHYAKWSEIVAPMMAGARTREKYSNVFPDDAGW